MKPVIIVSFFCAFVGLALWLAPEKGASGEPGPDITTRNRNAYPADASAVTAPTETRTRSRERPEQPTGAQKWLRNLLSQQPSLRGPKGFDMEALARFRTKLDSLNTDEILGVLRELDATDASPNEKRQLASFIAGSLARRDPRLALDEFIGRISDSPTGTMRQLGIIYQMWAVTDVAAAASWFDQQVSKGTLNVESGLNGKKVDPRAEFESLLVRVQAARDPLAAAARFAAMTESARAEALRDH